MVPTITAFVAGLISRSFVSVLLSVCVCAIYVYQVDLIASSSSSF